MVPGHFLNWDLDSDRGIRLKHCALRKSAAVRDNRRERGLLRRRDSRRQCVDVVILKQLQPLHAGMPVLADDDVIVHGDAMSMIAFVIRISACDSVGSTEG